MARIDACSCCSVKRYLQPSASSSSACSSFTILYDPLAVGSGDGPDVPAVRTGPVEYAVVDAAHAVPRRVGDTEARDRAEIARQESIRSPTFGLSGSQSWGELTSGHVFQTGGCDA